MEKQMRGIYAIPPTPFNQNLDIDEGALRSCVRFCIEAGGHGIVLPVNASEFSYLSDDERKMVVEIAVKETAGRVPVVAGVAGVCTKVAVMFAKHAEAAGADAIIAMPPYVNKASQNEIYDYFNELSKSVNLPIFIQNFTPPIGTPLSAEFLIKLVREIENVKYIKEETVYSSHVITQLINLSKELPEGKFMGVMGGKAGRCLIDEYRRGVCGNMPACEVVDIQVQIWEALEAGDDKKAIEIYNKVLPLLNFEINYGAVLYKQVLKHRGVISHSYIRSLGGKSLDEMDYIEFERIMKEIDPLFKVRY